MIKINRNKILVIAAHPDDEILGLGGTLNYLKKFKNSIKVVIMSKGIASRYELNDKKNISKEIQSHLNCINESKKIIGYDDLVVHDLPDNKFDSIPILDVIKIVEKEIEIAKDQLRQEGKPEAMLDNIAKGKIKRFFKDNTLINQAYIKDSKISVANYVKSIDPDLTLTGFMRIALG